MPILPSLPKTLIPAANETRSAIPSSLANLRGVLIVLSMRYHRVVNVERLDESLPCAVIEREDGLMLGRFVLALLFEGRGFAED